MGSTDAATVTPLRVLVVDDMADVRLMLKVQFQVDGRFAVVGEGADGLEAIQLAESLQPDLVVLDRQMPRLGGVEAIGPIRRVAPDTAIVLYTAAEDEDTHHAALAAGALGVLSKVAGARFVEAFTTTLLDRTADAAGTVEVRVGPVATTAARTWIANTRKIVTAVEARPDVVDVPEDVLELFKSLLARWEEAASAGDQFLWVARAAVGELSRVVEQWALIDAMTDEQLEQLGVRWAPPEGEPFFDALTTGVLHALQRHGETQRLADRLAEQWAPYRRGLAG